MTLPAEINPANLHHISKKSAGWLCFGSFALAEALTQHPFLSTAWQQQNSTQVEFYLAALAVKLFLLWALLHSMYMPQNEKDQQSLSVWVGLAPLFLAKLYLDCVTTPPALVTTIKSLMVLYLVGFVCARKRLTQGLRQRFDAAQITLAASLVMSLCLALVRPHLWLLTLWQ